MSGLGDMEHMRTKTTRSGFGLLTLMYHFGVQRAVDTHTLENTHTQTTSPERTQATNYIQDFER